MPTETPYTFVVVDDHDSVLEGTCSVLQSEYPNAKILTARSADQVENLVADTKPDVIVIDLSLPYAPGDEPHTSTGLTLLTNLLTTHKSLNVVVQSAHAQTLVRLKPLIDAHRAGLTISDKSAPSREMLTKVDWALQGLVFTPPEMRVGLEIKHEWLTMLELAFNEGLIDKVIAKKMNVSERTVRHYWTRTQDALGVYPEEGCNIRVQTHNKARQAGLLD